METETEQLERWGRYLETVPVALLESELAHLEVLVSVPMPVVRRRQLLARAAYLEYLVLERHARVQAVFESAVAADSASAVAGPAGATAADDQA
jgi:hypothetical protein